MDQGTIKSFDDEGRTGTVLTDERTEVTIDAHSLEGSDVRTLRIGQRVKFVTEEQDGASVARSLRIVTWD